MKLLDALAPLLLGLLRCCASISLEDEYPFSTVLKTDANGDPFYTLHWNFSVADDTITFGVNVSTNGWVGLGISPTGGMINSDVAIGWVNNEGQAFFHDRFAFEQSRPPIDPQQDWFIISGENMDGYTVLQFWRKWITCDERDRNIQADTSRVVYAWNDDDPANDDPDAVVYHGENRGSSSLNLLSGVTNPPENEDPSLVQSFTLAVDDVTIPSDDTTYWCAALEFPQEIQQQKQYIIRFSPKITPNDFQYVHHMLIYLCGSLDETEVGVSAPCEGMVGETVTECRSGSLIAGWAVGGADFIYPENVAYPLGGPDTPRYVVIEIHYDNPMQHSGIKDSSGIEFFYLSEPRAEEAGIITLGHHVNNAMIIPPRTSRHNIFGKCGGVCTSQYIPPEGIKVFGNLLHTHLVGRGLTLRLIRDSPECDGLEQLKPIDQNLQYDFNFQQFVVLPKEVTVYPGDILLLECNYDTSEREGVVLGGESTRQEMCLSFLAYYPRTPMSACFSSPTLESFFPFAAQFIPEEHQQVVFESIIFNTTEVAEAVLNQYVEWSPEAAIALQESVFRGELVSFCLSDEDNFTNSTEEVLPDIQCPYEPPELCAAGSIGLNNNKIVITGLLILCTAFL